eukprot:1190755-Prorocentrum_minimum.AAC.3
MALLRGWRLVWLQCVQRRGCGVRRVGRRAHRTSRGHCRELRELGAFSDPMQPVLAVAAAVSFPPQRRGNYPIG